MRFRIPVFALASSVLLFGMSVAVAQSGQPSPAPAIQPAPFKNLKVLPRDIARPELLSRMKFFSQSLGVRCTYCHVGTEGQPLSTFDFASDAKQHKKIAREMMRLTQHINAEHLPAIAGLPNAKVTCFTCHRGATKPATELPPAVSAPPGTPAAPAAPPLKTERGAG
jgi:hypothetical protein